MLLTSDGTLKMAESRQRLLLWSCRSRTAALPVAAHSSRCPTQHRLRSALPNRVPVCGRLRSRGWDQPQCALLQRHFARYFPSRPVLCWLDLGNRSFPSYNAHIYCDSLSCRRQRTHGVNRAVQGMSQLRALTNPPLPQSRPHLCRNVFAD